MAKCARTACSNTDAPCEHRFDHRFYCVPCARKINEHNPATPPLVTIPPPPVRPKPVNPYVNRT